MFVYCLFQVSQILAPITRVHLFICGFDGLKVELEGKVAFL